MSKSKQNTRDRKGFTILELVAVVGIILAMSAIVVSNFSAISRTTARASGVAALRKAITLCRQHACIDGRDTYLFITGNDSYYIARRGGSVTENRPQNTQQLDKNERPPYLDGNTPLTDTIWIYDAFADLGSSVESFVNMDKDGVVVQTKNDKLDFNESYANKGQQLFDLKEGKAAYVKFPPWFDSRKNAWIMGIKNVDTEGKTLTAFKEDSIYGWAVYPERKLPNGYYFVSSKDNYIDSGCIYFMPDGRLGTDGKTLLGNSIRVQEAGSGILSGIDIDGYGRLQDVFE